MFLDILKLRVKNNKNKLEKTVFVMWSQICEKMSKIVWLIAWKNIISEIWTSRGFFFTVTQFVTQFTHVSRHP